MGTGSGDVNNYTVFFPNVKAWPYSVSPSFHHYTIYYLILPSIIPVSLTGAVQISVRQTCHSSFLRDHLWSAGVDQHVHSCIHLQTHTGKGNNKGQHLKIVNSLQILSQTRTHWIVYAHEMRLCTTVLSEEIFYSSARHCNVSSIKCFVLLFSSWNTSRLNTNNLLNKLTD